MGGGHSLIPNKQSKQANPSSPQQKQHRNSGTITNLLKQTTASTYKPPPLVAAKTQWKEFGKTSTLYKQIEKLCTSTDEIELCTALDDPIGQKYLGKFTKSHHNEEILYCFIEILEYNVAPSSSYRKSKAIVIYKKYIKLTAVMALGCITKNLSIDYETKINEAKEDYTLFTDDFFTPILKLCFNDLFQHTWISFKISKEYELYKNEMKNSYNKVCVDDFEYLEILGSGGFGRVVHARKKSTNKHYAMKIQLKKALLEEYSNDLSQITTEKVILEACNFPYIVDMHYSFQTPEHAIIVLAYVRGGDLAELLKASNEWRLPEDQVKLYAAEIAVALNHLHEMGILYRDLKPGNILLNEDGHIKLADMGLATTAEVLNHKQLTVDMFHTPLLVRRSLASSSAISYATILESSQNTPRSDPFNIKHHSSLPHNNPTVSDDIKQIAPSDLLKSNENYITPAKNARRKTTVGTRGYMAPELLRGKLRKREDRKGYNLSVDYWALGITIYELLCGHQPFETRNPLAEVFGDVEERPHIDPRKQTQIELEKVTTSPIEFPSNFNISNEAQSFVKGLLDINEDLRLGCTNKGFNEIMNHSFFKDIDWDKLLAKHIEPAYKPTLKELADKKKFSNFNTMLQSFNQKEGGESKYNWNEKPLPKDQIYFSTWDYISPATLKSELGISIEMEETNIPFKVLQLTGNLPNQLDN